MALVHLKFYSPSLQTKTNISVLIPTPESTLQGHQETFRECAQTGPFPVLYLLHGTSGDEDDWIRFSRIEDYARKYDLMVVMPSCENSSYRDTPAGKAYYTYVTEELPALIRWMFPASDKREDTFIAGLSMGGSGAFKLGMSRPDLYSHVACLSGAFGIQESALAPGSRWAWAYDSKEDLEHSMENPAWLMEQLMQSPSPRPSLYLCCGTEDFLYGSTAELKRLLESIGYPFTYHEQPGVHDWNIWDDEIKRILQWLPVSKKGDTRYL